MKARIIGIVILIVVVAGALVYQFVIRPSQGSGLPAITVKAYVGSEKAGYLDDQNVKDILSKRYGITIDYSKAGSFEMMDMDPTGVDVLWPASQSAVEYLKAKGKSYKSADVIFSSPLVVYSWAPVAAALEKAGLVHEEGGTLWLDTAGLLKAASTDKTWKDLGLSDLNGKVTLSSSDPALSNSGYMFAALAGDVLAGDVVDETLIPRVMPTISELFRRQGIMEHSTGTLFERYLLLGMGSFPLVVGYENLIVEFSLQKPDVWKRVAASSISPVILYPEPTAVSEHVIVSLSDAGLRLAKALDDPELKKIAWEAHGFRSGIEDDPSKLAIKGIAPQVTKVVRMPRPDVMDKVLEGLK